MSNIKADTLSNLAGTQSVPVATVAQGSAKAWVNFNGTGTVSIQASFNVSSITDNGTGTYTVNFTTAMPDANYIVVGTANQAPGTNRCLVISGSFSVARTVSTAFMAVVDTATNAGIDNSEVCLSIFR